MVITKEALPGVLGNRENRAFTGEQRQYWRTGNIRKQIFDFWGTGEQANLFQGNMGTGTPPGRASPKYAMTIKILADHIMFISLHNSQREYSKMSGFFSCCRIIYAVQSKLQVIWRTSFVKDVI